MRIAQGVNPTTRLRHAMRTVRAQYLDNVRNKRCKLDPSVLAKCDALLRKLDGKGKGIPPVR